MDIAKYRCLTCQQSELAVYATLWRCRSCGQVYPCVSGIPALYREARLAANDRRLRDCFYDGFIGSYYSHVMPFLTLPARPFRLSWRDWTVYAVVLACLAGLAAHLGGFLLVRGIASWTSIDILLLAVAGVVAVFLWSHWYLASLIVLAIPVKISLLLNRFDPVESFVEIHERIVQELRRRPGTLQLLDVSTGNCASLYKHGWLTLDAEYAGVDLSATMLLQGLEFMADKQVPVQLALADAAELPFRSETFDVVLNYGAINGMSDPGLALREMSRVAKKGGIVLFFDEQLHGNASRVEKAYFDRVLSSHNVIHRCPVELLPPDLKDVEVHQVYQFYYICVGTKA